MRKLWALLLALTLLLAGCGGGESFPHFADGDTVGEGETSFTLTILDDQETQVRLTVRTDAETVGEALQAEHIVFGTDGEYGLYIETVNGLTLDYDETGSYWAFYVDGAYAQQSADQTPVEDGGDYALKAETIQR